MADNIAAQRAYSARFVAVAVHGKRGVIPVGVLCKSEKLKELHGPHIRYLPAETAIARKVSECAGPEFRMDLIIMEDRGVWEIAVKTFRGLSWGNL